MARQKRHYTATHKSLYAEGSSKAEASAKLEAMIDWALEDRQMHIESRFGWVIIISATASGYQSKVFRPEDLKHGERHWAGCSHSEREFKSVLQSCLNHAAQNAWTHETDDEAHIVASGLDKEHASELKRWIGFQRRHAVLKARGATDGEAFNQALAA